MKDWPAYKERGKRIDEYLKRGGRPVIRTAPQKVRGAIAEAGTEIVFPPGYRNYRERREDAKRNRKLNRIMRRAKAAGRDPGPALRRFFGENKPAGMPRPPKRTLKRNEPKPGLLQRMKNLFRRGNR